MTAGGAGPGEAEARERDVVAAVVSRTVRLRFALGAEPFAGRLLELVRASGPGHGSAASLAAHVERLSLDDLYLASACALGDENAWAECADRHFGFVRGFARRFLREPAAGDLADQVIADLWQRGKIGRYEGRSTLPTWLGTVVAHAALNAAQANRREVAWRGVEPEGRGADLVATNDPPEEKEARSALRRILAEAVSALNPEEKVLLLLYYEQGLTLDEMAGTLHLSRATLSRRLARIRDQLRTTVDALARARLGSSSQTLLAGLDLRRLEFDLGRLLANRREAEQEVPGTVSRTEAGR